MTRNDLPALRWKLSFDYVQIGAADTTGYDPDEELPIPGLRCWSIQQHQGIILDRLRGLEDASLHRVYLTHFQVSGFEFQKRALSIQTQPWPVLVHRVAAEELAISLS